MKTPGHHRERGQATLLIVGFAIVLVLMVAVVVDASAAYLRRQGLDSVADGAALFAADSARGREVYTGQLGDRAWLDPALARRDVDDYLRTSGAAVHYPGLAVSVDTTATQVVVRVSAPLHLPIVPPGWVRRPVISATAASYVAVSP